MDETLAAVRAEAERAADRYGPFTSTHEALGVLVEEIEELRGAIRDNVIEAVKLEAIQVAAVAARLASCCDYNTHAAFIERSIP